MPHSPTTYTLSNEESASPSSAIHAPEILETKTKYPKWYAFRTGVPGAFAMALLLWVTIGYLLYIIFGWSKAIFSVGFLILIYYIRRLVRGMEYIVSTIVALFQLKRYETYDFAVILKASNQGSDSVSIAGRGLGRQHSIALKKLPTDKKPTDIVHRCMIPMYNEGPEILYETIHAIATSDYDLSRVAVTIQGEARKEDCFRKALAACEPLTQHFGYFGWSLHELQDDEMPGKGANITYGAQLLYQDILSHFNTTADNVLLTTLDADNIVDKDYFSILSYTYLTTPNRKHASYQPVIFFFNNFREAPFFSQVVSLFNTFWILFNFTKKLGPRNFSSHAQPLDALIELGFRSKQTIVEDGHQYRRSFFGYKGEYECVPVFAKIYQDCNLDESTVKTVKAQYNQMRRRAHGAQDIPYTRSNMLEQRHTIKKGRALFEFFRSLEGILLWSTLHVILLAGLGFSLFRDIPLSSFISLGSAISLFTKIALTLTVSCLLLSISVFPFHKLTNKQDMYKRIAIFVLFFFFLVGPSLVIFAGLPALHTQIALLFGKPMKSFNVTKKVR